MHVSDPAVGPDVCEDRHGQACSLTGFRRRALVTFSRSSGWTSGKEAVVFHPGAPGASAEYPVDFLGQDDLVRPQVVLPVPHAGDLLRPGQAAPAVLDLFFPSFTFGDIARKAAQVFRAPAVEPVHRDVDGYDPAVAGFEPGLKTGVSPGFSPGPRQSAMPRR